MIFVKEVATRNISAAAAVLVWVVEAVDVVPGSWDWTMSCFLVDYEFPEVLWREDIAGKVASYYSVRIFLQNHRGEAY